MQLSSKYAPLFSVNDEIKDKIVFVWRQDDVKGGVYCTLPFVAYTVQKGITGMCTRVYVTGSYTMLIFVAQP